MGDLSRWEEFRLWLAGAVFRLAGRIHCSYDVWLDDAVPRWLPEDMAEWQRRRIAEAILDVQEGQGDD